MGENTDLSRRGFLKGTGAVAVLSGAAASTLLSRKANAAGWMFMDTTPITPDSHQASTVAALADAIIPNWDGQPGATESGAYTTLNDPWYGVNPYIDELTSDIDEWSWTFWPPLRNFTSLDNDEKDECIAERLGQDGSIASLYKDVYLGCIAITKLNYFGALVNTRGTDYIGFPAASEGYLAGGSSGIFWSADTPLNIPDNNVNGINSYITASGGGTVKDLKVTVWITHTYQGDLVITLRAPSGVETTLWNRQGGSADNIWFFDLPVTAFDGQSQSGTWRLHVHDAAGADVGTLWYWGMKLRNRQDGPAMLVSSGAPVAIPDNNVTGIESYISSSVPGTVTSAKVTAFIKHTWRGDLVVKLYSPAGTEYVLWSQAGGSADDLFLPNVDVTAAYSGQTAAGTWRLHVHDAAGADVGTLESWSLELRTTVIGEEPPMASVIVIGSGFGGSIAAKRFTEAGHSVTILEMGEDWRSPAKLKQSQDTKFILRVFRDYPNNYMQTRPKLVVTQGMGLGGGSLVYSAIHLRAPTSAFTGWPGGFTRARLDAYYTRVETRLGVAPLPNAASFKRTIVFAEAASLRGLPAPVANPLAMTGCTACGWCVPICKWGKKNTMAHTYLKDAQATGLLTIITNAKAKWVKKNGAQYSVEYWRTDSKDHDYHTVNSGTLYSVTADKVVVACGAIESPALLKRSVPYLSWFDTTNLGNGIDGTGDFVQGGMVNRDVQSYKGAIMMNYIDRGDYVLEDIHAIPVGPTVKFESTFPDLVAYGAERTWGLAYKQRLRDYGKKMFGIAIMGKQSGGTAGNISVSDDNGNAVVSTTPFAPPVNAINDARGMIQAVGGTPINTVWERSGTTATVHPTGGCRMGDSTTFPVQATDLQLRGNPSLYVIDGSVLPGSPLRNPSNTIAAVAERAMDVILNVYAPTTWP